MGQHEEAELSSWRAVVSWTPCETTRGPGVLARSALHKSQGVVNRLFIQTNRYAMTDLTRWQDTMGLRKNMRSYQGGKNCRGRTRLPHTEQLIQKPKPLNELSRLAYCLWWQMTLTVTVSEHGHLITSRVNHDQHYECVRSDPQ